MMLLDTDFSSGVCFSFSEMYLGFKGQYYKNFQNSCTKINQMIVI